FDLVNPTREAARLSPHVRARAGDQARPFARASVTLPSSADLLSLPNTRGIIARCKQTAYPPNTMIHGQEKRRATVPPTVALIGPVPKEGDVRKISAAQCRLQRCSLFVIFISSLSVCKHLGAGRTRSNPSHRTSRTRRPSAEETLFA